MPDVAEQPTKRRRGMLAFYAAGLVLVVLAVFGAWMWTTWDNWQFDEHEAKRRQAEAARQLGVPVETAIDLGDGVKLELVLIPPGMFDMGSPGDEPGRDHWEGPLHRVRISRGFYMGEYEVTQEQWQKMMGNNPGNFKGPKLPVEQVSWYDCQDFLKKLNALGKVKGQFRLPTEAEWEWACRAGTKTRFCFGDGEAKLGEYAWYEANSGETTHPVGEKRPNAWGLYDCCGNVLEWCSDWFGEYSANPWPGRFRWTRDPQGANTGPDRVLRGGAWANYPYLCRSARRLGSVLTDRFNTSGFRVALSVAGP